MRGYYLYVAYNDMSKGVEKKIREQCACMKENDIDCEPLPIKCKQAFLYKLTKRLPFGKDDLVWPCVEIFKEVDFIYIRQVIKTIDFRMFLKKIKKINPSIQIYMEIPTYPYDDSIKSAGMGNYPLLLREDYGRKHLVGLIDAFFVIGLAPEMLWGIPVVHIKNGIMTRNTRLRMPQENDGIIKVLCLASFQAYHGIDLFVEGMQKYYANKGDREIHLYLAGEGEGLDPVRKLVNENQTYLADRIHFCGVQNVDGMQKLMDLCDMGIVSLGYSRIGLKYNTTLKSKEYLAAGLPIISDSVIDVLDDIDLPYILYIKSKEEPVDMNHIIDFYNKLYDGCSMQEKRMMASEIREKVMGLIDLKTTMLPIIEQLKKEKAC